MNNSRKNSIVQSFWIELSRGGYFYIARFTMKKINIYIPFSLTFRLFWVFYYKEFTNIFAFPTGWQHWLEFGKNIDFYYINIFTLIFQVVYLQRANRQKKVTDINFTFADESRGGGGRGRGRGGRGRDRDGGRRDDRDGGRGDGPRRGGPRGDARGSRGGGGSRGGKKEFNLNNDMKDFPTLG